MHVAILNQATVSSRPLLNILHWPVALSICPLSPPLCLPPGSSNGGSCLWHVYSGCCWHSSDIHKLHQWRENHVFCNPRKANFYPTTNLPLSLCSLLMYVCNSGGPLVLVAHLQTHIFVYKLHTKITMLSQQGNYTPFIINTNKLSLIQLEYGMGSRCTYPYLAQISLSPLNEGVNHFAFVVGTWVEKETNQLSLIVWLQLEHGMVTSSILQHLPPNFAVPPI